MTAHAETLAARPLLIQYLSVLRDLTELAELEAALLDQGVAEIPASLERQQEVLAQDYALLSAALKPRIRDLHDAGLLNVEALEINIRHLVALTKENRRRRYGRQVPADDRVDAVMQALPDDHGDSTGRRPPATTGPAIAPPQS